MNILGGFFVYLCVLVLCGPIYAQDDEVPMRGPGEIPVNTRRPLLHRVTQGVPRVRVMSTAVYGEDGGDLGIGETGMPRRVTVEPDISIRTSGRPPRVTEIPVEVTTVNSAEVTTGNPVEITTKQCPGCPIEIHHNDTNIQKYARNATYIYKERKEIPRDATLERVYDVKRQVINGVRYDFKMVFSYSADGSNIKNMITCEVEVTLHHTRPRAHINAKPCKKPRIPGSQGAGEEKLEGGNSDDTMSPMLNFF